MDAGLDAMGWCGGEQPVGGDKSGPFQLSFNSAGLDSKPGSNFVFQNACGVGANLILD